MTERFQRMKDTLFQGLVGAIITAILGVCTYIAFTAVSLTQTVAILSERVSFLTEKVEITNQGLKVAAQETRESQEQIYKFRWELAQWKKEEQESQR